MMPAGKILPPWVENPYRLISWWEMEKFSAADFYKIGRLLSILEHETDAFKELTQDISGEGGGAIRKHLRPGMVEACEEIGLIFAVKHINHLCERLDAGITFVELREKISALSLHVMFEMQAQLFFHVPSKDASYYSQHEPLFFEGFRDAFPSVISEVEEAGKCLALNRHTASVFHLMHVMEVALKALARKLEIPYAPSWESYLRQISNRLSEKWKDKPLEWKNDEGFYRDAAALLLAVKIAWRNPTMHMVRSYSFDEAKEVFESVRGFMRHLATKLKE
jgi:hypothetical protein